jgi:hypothetical protein
MGRSGNPEANEETEVIVKMRFIPTNVHGAIDRAVGPALILAPTLLRIGSTSPEGITVRAVGSVQRFYSNLTDYETSGQNVVPMNAHLALDALGGAALALVPQFTGARKRGKKHWVPHLALGALEIGLAALTRTQPPKGHARPNRDLAKLVAKAKVAGTTARDAVNAVV